MKQFPLLVLILTLLSLPLAAQDWQITSLNTMWFFNPENTETRIETKDRPTTQKEYNQRAGHLIGLLPPSPPVLVALQEVGDQDDVAALARAATARYQRPYQPLFLQGRDTQTGQDVGFLFDPDQGWEITGQPSRPADLDRALSKHLVVVLENRPLETRLMVCNVHLRRPIGEDGGEKQKQQIRALLKWSYRFLGQDPQSNIIILGDFNLTAKPGEPGQNIDILLKHGFVDALYLHYKKPYKTHAAGALDRILISPAIATGKNHLGSTRAEVVPHHYAKLPPEKRRLYTDHYPVTLTFQTTRQSF
jgi:hypothetical protein